MIRETINPHTEKIITNNQMMHYLVVQDSSIGDIVTQ